MNTRHTKKHQEIPRNAKKYLQSKCKQTPATSKQTLKKEAKTRQRICPEKTVDRAPHVSSLVLEHFWYTSGYTFGILLVYFPGAQHNPSNGLAEPLFHISIKR